MNSSRRYHEIIDPHIRAPRIAQLILGGQDGLVNVLGVILGVAAATHSTRVVLVAAVAAAIAESVSMAAVAYTSTAAEGDHFEGERARELRHIEAVPDLERDEIRAIYKRKGFAGPLLERVVETITKDKEVWVAVMMAEEHMLKPLDRRASLRSCVIVGVSALVGSLLPLVPFVVLPVSAAAWSAVVLGAAALFAFGAYKARVTTIGHPLKSGAELAAIGVLSALAGWVVGVILRV
jgi:predicted membrane protein (TIGR00267 family)